MAERMRRLLRRSAAWVRRLGATGTVGLLLGFAVLAGAVVGPILTPYSPLAFVGGPFDPPSAGTPLGTDVIGRDVLSRLMAGGERLLGLSVLATAIGVLGGTLCGIVAGYRKGFLDEAIMRGFDVLLAFPQMILALLFISMIGPRAWLIVLLVAAVHGPQVARVMRAATLRVAEEDFVRFSEAIGMSTARILMSEILPNLTGPLMVELGLRFTYSTALIAALGFLGLMDDPSVPDWGMMMNENRIGVGSNLWGVAAPAMALAVLTVAINLFTDALARVTLAPASAEDGADAEPDIAPLAAMPLRMDMRP